MAGKDVDPEVLEGFLEKSQGSLARMERKIDMIMENMGIKVQGKILATPKQVVFIKDLSEQLKIPANEAELKQLTIEQASSMIVDLKHKRTLMGNHP